MNGNQNKIALPDMSFYVISKLVPLFKTLWAQNQRFQMCRNFKIRQAYGNVKFG